VMGARHQPMKRCFLRWKKAEIMVAPNVRDDAHERARDVALAKCRRRSLC